MLTIFSLIDPEYILSVLLKMKEYILSVFAQKWKSLHCGLIVTTFMAISWNEVSLFLRWLETSSVISRVNVWPIVSTVVTPEEYIQCTYN